MYYQLLFHNVIILFHVFQLFAVKKFVIQDKLTTLDRVTLFASELIATGILVFVGCMGCVTRIAGGSIPHEQISWTFGLAVMIAIQVSHYAPHVLPHLNIDSYLLVVSHKNSFIVLSNKYLYRNYGFLIVY